MNLFTLLAIAIIWIATFVSTQQNFIIAIVGTFLVLALAHHDAKNKETKNKEATPIEPLEEINDPYLTMNGHETSTGPVFPTNPSDKQVHFLQEEDEVKIFHYDELGKTWTKVGNLPHSGGGSGGGIPKIIATDKL